MVALLMILYTLTFLTGFSIGWFAYNKGWRARTPIYREASSDV